MLYILHEYLSTYLYTKIANFFFIYCFKKHSCLNMYNTNRPLNERLSPATLNELAVYLRRSQGYTGSIFQNTIGDLSKLNSDGTLSSGGAESHFAMVLLCVYFGLVASDLSVSVLETFFKITGNGGVAHKATYWEIIERFIVFC